MRSKMALNKWWLGFAFCARTRSKTNRRRRRWIMGDWKRRWTICAAGSGSSASTMTSARWSTSSSETAGGGDTQPHSPGVGRQCGRPAGGLATGRYPRNRQRTAKNQCSGSAGSISFPWIRIRIKSWARSESNDTDPDPTKTIGNRK